MVWWCVSVTVVLAARSLSRVVRTVVSGSAWWSRHPSTGRQRESGSTGVVESWTSRKADFPGRRPRRERRVAMPSSEASDQTPIQPAQSASPAESNSGWPDLTMRLRLNDAWREGPTQAFDELSKSGWQDRPPSLRVDDDCVRRFDAGLSVDRIQDGRYWQDQPSPKDRD